MNAREWLIYRGTGEPHDGIADLPDPPPWRDFNGGPVIHCAPGDDTTSTRRLGIHRGLAELHRPRPEELEVINAALYLRRPLLVTGNPGTGKSTLAHAVAHELRLGRVLRWPVVSRTELQDGLYHYDAIGRLQDVQLGRGGTDDRLPPADPPERDDLPGVPPLTPDVVSGSAPARSAEGRGIGSYIRLGPLGTALLPVDRPRVLLVDELDKSDIDLPNDLLNALEEGEFSIPELERIAEYQPEVSVLTDDGTQVAVRDGRVRCRAFPFVVLTSNGERDFSAALLRRCIHLQLAPPDKDRLATMVRAHLGEEAAGLGDDLIDLFLSRSPEELVAADQLLNAIYLTQYAARSESGTRARLAQMLMRRLDRSR